VLTGEIGDEIGGGIDGSAVDQLHASTLAADCDSSPVAAGTFACSIFTGRLAHRYRGPQGPRGTGIRAYGCNGLARLSPIQAS
jgi:hypothetical protein